jgi:vitamin B12 transporter
MPLFLLEWEGESVACQARRPASQFVICLMLRVKAGKISLGYIYLYLFTRKQSLKKLKETMRNFFAVTAILISSQLLAQQEKTDSLQEVTVTANKYSTKTTETGKVVTIISRQEIEHAGSRDLAQVITELGGVFINGYNGNPGKEKNIYLRGAKVDYTLITIDGIPVYDAAGIGSNFDIRYIPVDNVDRIEILKGSQSTLYGSDAIAGVINIITKKNANKPFSLSGIAEYGSYNTWRGNATVSGTNKALDYNLSYTTFSSTGFSEAKQPATATLPFDNDNFKQNAVQANLGIQATGKLKIQPFLRYSTNTGGLDQDAFVDELDYTYSAKNVETGIRNSLQVGRGQLNVVYQLNNTNRNYIDDSTKSRNGFFIYENTTYKAREHFAEANVVYPFSSLKLTAGTDFRQSNSDYTDISNNIYSPALTTTKYSGDLVKQQQVGVYAALNYFKNNWNIEAGGRANHHSEYGNNFAYNLNGSWLIEKTLKAFANISSGYRVPSLFQLFSQYGNLQLKPESSINYEGGLQYFVLNNKASVRATYFDRHINNVIAFFFDPVTYRSQYINQDKQNDHGIELEAKANISKWQLKLLYNYVDGNITTKQNGKDTTYFNLLRRPKSFLTASVASQVTGALYVSLQANATGKSKDVYYDPSFQRHDITLDNYFLLNFYTEYAFAKSKLKLFADLRNITNKEYMDIYGYNTAGFNAYAGIRFRL